jgi:Icc-related predicted phosphoesterase
MKITAFGDSHGHHRAIVLPKSDLLIFAGDVMTCGYKEHELIDFLEWYNDQDASNKIMVAGNHDRYIEDNRGLFLDLLKQYPSITYLENEGTVINGLFFWGTPDSKEFGNWAFNRTEPQLEKIFSQIPFDVDILVSHAPQYGVLDKPEGWERVGEKSLSKQFKRFTNIKYHIFGHIHSAYGQNNNGHKSLNVSVVNDQYELQNKPVTFSLMPHGLISI